MTAMSLNVFENCHLAHEQFKTTRAIFLSLLCFDQCQVTAELYLKLLYSQLFGSFKLM